MKKIIIILVFLLIVSGVIFYIIIENGKEEVPRETESIPTEHISEEITTDFSIPNEVGLYLKNRSQGRYERISEYQGQWNPGKDIKSFEAFASNLDIIQGDTYGNLWKNHWNDHPDSEQTKIGYEITFALVDGKEFVQTIVRPSDTVGEFNEYIEIWLYDDIFNLESSWYSHLTEDDFTEDSLCTSIKLTAGNKINELEKLSLKVFLYKEAIEFEEETGLYKGKNSYEITLIRTN